MLQKRTIILGLSLLVLGTYLGSAAAKVNPGFHPQAQAADDQKGAIEFVIRLPADATLELDGHKMKETGAVRTYVTPPVPLDGHYQYTLKATSQGKEVTRTVHLAFGTDNTFDLRAEFLKPAASRPEANQITSVGSQKYKYTTEIEPGVAVPDKIDSSIGTLNLSYGYPKADTVEKIYDNLDRSRALQAYLMAIPIVNQAGMRDSIRKFGPDNQTNVIWENLVDPRTVELTANDNTVYNFIWLDTKKGPLVVEIPPEVLGGVNDFWYRWVADVGITGEDRGKGGKYLVLPPGYKGEIPAGYTVIRPNTFGNWLFFRAFLVDGSTKPGVESVKKHLKIYQLSEAANPPKMKFANASGVPSNFVAPGDYAFWELLNKVIQEEPSEGSDPTTLGLFASVGIVKGQPFSPDARMKKILTDAANIGAVTARTIAFKVRSKDAYFFPNSAWRLPFFGGYKFESAPGVTNMDGYIFYYYFATGVTPPWR